MQAALDIGNFVDAKNAFDANDAFTDTDTITGKTIDLRPAQGAQKILSILFVVAFGTATGTFGGQNHAVKLQESDDDSTWTDISGKTANVTADEGVAKLSLRTREGERKRYVRVHITAAFTTDTDGSQKVGGCAITAGGQIPKT